MAREPAYTIRSGTVDLVVSIVLFGRGWSSKHRLEQWSIRDAVTRVRCIPHARTHGFRRVSVPGQRKPSFRKLWSRGHVAVSQISIAGVKPGGGSRYFSSRLPAQLNNIYRRNAASGCSLQFPASTTRLSVFLRALAAGIAPATQFKFGINSVRGDPRDAFAG